MKELAYEMTGNTKVNSKAAKKYHLDKELSNISVGKIVWYLLGRAVWPHRFAISFAINIYLLVIWLFPFVPDLIKAIVSSML